MSWSRQLRIRPRHLALAIHHRDAEIGRGQGIQIKLRMGDVVAMHGKCQIPRPGNRNMLCGAGGDLELIPLQIERVNFCAGCGTMLSRF